MHPRGRRVWLFDLDNTLHDATPHIFPHINRAMRDYIAQHLTVDHQKADEIRQHYWQRYGATLLGLMRHHQTDPEHFLWETHQFPDLPRQLCFSQAVRHLIKRLPGRKILFSNAPRHYTEAILALTGLAPLFSTVYTVERVKFQPKPMPQGFRHLLRAEGLHPRDCIMVEDSLDNLVTAKRLGMTTIWIHRGMRQSPYVDIKLRHILELGRRHPTPRHPTPGN